MSFLQVARYIGRNLLMIAWESPSEQHERIGFVFETQLHVSEASFPRPRTCTP